MCKWRNKMKNHKKLCFMVVTLLLVTLSAAISIELTSIPNKTGDVFINPLSIDMEINEHRSVSILSTINQKVNVTWCYLHPDIVDITPHNLILKQNALNASIFSLRAGHTTAQLVTNDSAPDVKEIVKCPIIRISVYHSLTLHTLEIIIGWAYFFAWTLSFYPQIFENFKRKSVIGLNFDFLVLNTYAFVCYFLFNCGLYYVPAIQQEYHDQHPLGVIQVKLNDVFFSANAVICCLLMIVQCFFYDRGDQTISKKCLLLLSAISCFVFLTLGFSLFKIINWLTYLYYFSYIKLGITFIKYIPQAYYNYSRQSTVGWSIGNILLDFSGGILSILQMFIVSYNNNDWASIFGDFTKFGLGLFSCCFDVLFIFQHYVFYRNSRSGYSVIAGSNEE